MEREESAMKRSRIWHRDSSQDNACTRCPSEKSKLQRKTWMLEKRLQRANKHKAKKRTPTGPEPTAGTTAPNTPRSKTNSAIREAGVSPRSLPPQIRKQLLFAQVMADEVSTSLNTRSTSFNKSTGRGLAASIVSGKLLHRYRLIRRMGKAISVNRSLLNQRGNWCIRRSLAWPKSKRSWTRPSQSSWKGMITQE